MIGNSFTVLIYFQDTFNAATIPHSGFSVESQHTFLQPQFSHFHLSCDGSHLTALFIEPYFSGAILVEACPWCTLPLSVPTPRRPTPAAT